MTYDASLWKACPIARDRQSDWAGASDQDLCKCMSLQDMTRHPDSSPRSTVGLVIARLIASPEQIKDPTL